MKRIKRGVAFILTVAMLVGMIAVNPVMGIDTVQAAVKPAGVQTGVNNTTLNQYGLTENVEDGTIFHAWCWSFNAIKENMSEIVAAGFSSVQTSPISQCLVGENGGMQIYGSGKWYYHYQPTKYTVGNYQMGTEEEFKEMCEVAHQYGVKVIVDSVINHCTSNYEAIDEEIKALGADAFHDMTVDNWSETDRYEETQIALSGLWDWNTQNKDVQNYLLSFLKDCVADGADGFRYDAAKLIELPDDTSEKYGNDFASDFWPTVLQNGATFQYGEVLQEGGNHVYSDELTGGYDDSDSSRLGAYQSLLFGENDEYNLHTTNSFYGWRLRDAISTSNLSVDFVSDFLLPTGASEENVVTWVESHDNYCNDASYEELSNDQVILAWAALAARKGGTPLFFNRPAGSTSKNPWGENVLGEAGNDTYKDAQVVAVNFFRNEMGDAEEYLSNPNDNTKVLMIERGTAGCVIVNEDTKDLVLNGAVVASMADGTYKDQVYGSEFTVENGKIYGTVKAGKAAVVYNTELETGDFNSEVSLSEPTQDFLTDSLDVAISVRGSASATYQIDDGEEIACVNGDVVTIGADAEVGTAIKITVNGYDSERNLKATTSATYTKQQAKGTTIVYFTDGAYGWSDVYAYVYASTPNGTVTNGNWPGVKLTKENGVYKYVLPYELESISSKVIFNNNSGKQTADLTMAPETQKILNPDKTWTTYTESAVSLSSGTCNFKTDTMDVTLYIRGCESATVKIGDEEAREAVNGETITIGEGLADGKSVTVTLKGIDSQSNEYVATATYTKKAYLENTKVYLNSAAVPDWNNFYVYIYTSGTNSTNNGGWPGKKMTDEGNGIYSYTLPYELEGQDTKIIFNSGSGLQLDELSLSAGTKMILESDKTWTAYRVMTGITATKTQVTYNVNDKVVYTDIKVNAQYDDGTSSEITDYTYGAISTAQAGTQKITISYKDFKTTISISVKKKSVSVPKATTGLVYNGSTQTGVATNSLYTVSGGTAVKAGTYTAKITLKNTTAYQWSDGTTAPKTITFKITPKSATTLKVSSISNKTYNGSSQTPTVTVKDGTKTLTRNTDYTVSYSNNKNVGKATVTIKFKGNYTGTKTTTFQITQKKSTTLKVSSISNKTYTGKSQTPTVTVKDGTKTLTRNTDYTVSYSNNKNVGKATVTIKFKGNYTGTKTVTFNIIPKKTTLKTITAARKALTVRWNKQTTQTSGYQIQYSTSKNFTSVKTKTVTGSSKTSTTLNGLSSNKTYYVRIRTYKKVNGVNYYSSWSSYKTKKVK